jgi:arsenate reductase
MTVTIYHNPACGTSRNTLAMIRQSGEQPEIIEYLKTPPDLATLTDLIRCMGITPRELLRRKGTPYDALGLDDPKWNDDELVDFMLSEPILINRPIVITPKGVRLCRPSETVLDILPNRISGRSPRRTGRSCGNGRAQSFHAIVFVRNALSIRCAHDFLLKPNRRVPHLWGGRT